MLEEKIRNLKQKLVLGGIALISGLSFYSCAHTIEPSGRAVITGIAPMTKQEFMSITKNESISCCEELNCHEKGYDFCSVDEYLPIISSDNRETNDFRVGCSCEKVRPPEPIREKSTVNLGENLLLEKAKDDCCDQCGKIIDYNVCIISNLALNGDGYRVSCYCDLAKVSPSS